MNDEPVRSFAAHHRLLIAMTGAIVIALIMTAISMSLYVTSGVQVLDVSRPGFEQARRAVNNSTFKSETFAQDGPIDSKVISEFDELYKNSRKELNAIDDFSNQKPLSDDSLNLAAE